MKNMSFKVYITMKGISKMKSLKVKRWLKFNCMSNNIHILFNRNYEAYKHEIYGWFLVVLFDVFSLIF